MIVSHFARGLPHIDRDATVARLAAGQKLARARGNRVEGRWPYGEHPTQKAIDADGNEVNYDKKREVVARIRKMSAEGKSAYTIAKTLNAEGMHTRYGCEFKHQTVRNILERC